MSISLYIFQIFVSIVNKLSIIYVVFPLGIYDNHFLPKLNGKNQHSDHNFKIKHKKARNGFYQLLCKFVNIKVDIK